MTQPNYANLLNHLRDPEYGDMLKDSIAAFILAAIARLEAAEKVCEAADVVGSDRTFEDYGGDFDRMRLALSSWREAKSS